jgi:hypothetical protein
MDRLSNVLTGFSLGLIILVLASLRRAHIRVEYSVSWLGAGLTLLVLSRSQRVLHWLAEFMGISDPPLALLIVVLAVFFVVFYRFTIMISNLKDANIALTQRVAILEYHLRTSHEERQA